MIVHHLMGSKILSFLKIVSDLGYKPNNKGMEDTWKALRTQNLVEEVSGGNQKKKVFVLTPKGIDKIATHFHRDEFVDPPKTTAELHQRIKAGAVNDQGIKIFDLLLEAREKKKAMFPKELASECGLESGSKDFSCAFKQLKDGGHAVRDQNNKRKWVLSDKCFLDG